MEGNLREIIYSAFKSFDDSIQDLLERNDFYDHLQKMIKDYPMSSFIPNIEAYLNDERCAPNNKSLLTQVTAQYEVALVYLNDYFRKEDSSYLDAFFTNVEKAYQGLSCLDDLSKSLKAGKNKRLFSFKNFLSTLIAYRKDVKQSLEDLKIDIFCPGGKVDEFFEEYADFLDKFDTCLNKQEVCRAELYALKIYEKGRDIGRSLDQVKSDLFSIFDRYTYLGDIPHAKDKYEHLERAIKELE